MHESVIEFVMPFGEPPLPPRCIREEQRSVNGPTFPDSNQVIVRADSANSRFGSCVTSVAGPNGIAQLRSFGFGDQAADSKPPQAAVVKSHSGERCGNAGTTILASTVERGERKRTEVSKAE